MNEYKNTFVKGIGRLLAIIFILAAVATVASYRDYFFDFYQTTSNLIVGPCKKTTTYSIESLDSRFGITEEKLRQAINEAAEIWNKAAGRKLFQYEENGDLTISLVYDNRQASVNEQKDLNSKVENKESSYNQLKASYDRAIVQYEKEKSQYETLQKQHKADTQAYENAVRELNRGGNATPEEVNKYNAERDRLNASADSLNIKVASLKAQVNTINGLAKDLNQLISELNLNIEGFNTISEELGEFQEGVYQEKGLDKQIIIYQFDDYEVLVRVLTHELGHSLNLEHVSDPEAVMYKINQGKENVLKEADLRELERVCEL